MKLVADCWTRAGYPLCYGAAFDRPCTCNDTSTLEHEQSEREAKIMAAARCGDLCHDCAFRKGSPEEDMRDRIMAGGPFYCHQGMPMCAVDGVPQDGEFRPRTDGRGAAPTYPVCAGWLRARRARGLP